MIDIRSNYKNKYPDMTCKNEPETQEHVLDNCNAIHIDYNTKVPTTDIFSEDTKTLKQTAKKIRKILETLQEPERTAHTP